MLRRGCRGIQLKNKPQPVRKARCPKDVFKEKNE